MVNQLPLAVIAGQGSEVDWEAFGKYIETARSSKRLMLYAKKYGSVLFTHDAQPLLMLTNETRKNVMKSLSALSKFMGCYDVWKDIKQKYQLKWSEPDSALTAFEEIYSGERTFTTMTNWLHKALDTLPPQYANILLFSTLTGLRPDEACQSIHLLKNPSIDYLNRERMVLEHFKHPQIFIRKTKKAYISLVTPSILQLVNESGDLSYNSIRLAVNRRNLPMHMKYCRSIFATSLRKSGLEQEMVDMLQGRVPKSVFTKHYFRPDFMQDNLKVTEAIENLRGMLTKKREEKGAVDTKP